MDTRKLLLPTLIAALLASPLAFAQDTNADAGKDQAAAEQADATAADATADADKAKADKDKKDKKDAAEGEEQAAEPEEDDKK